MKLENYFLMEAALQKNWDFILAAIASRFVGIPAFKSADLVWEPEVRRGHRHATYMLGYLHHRIGIEDGNTLVAGADWSNVVNKPFLRISIP